MGYEMKVQQNVRGKGNEKYIATSIVQKGLISWIEALSSIFTGIDLHVRDPILTKEEEKWEYWVQSNL